MSSCIFVGTSNKTKSTEIEQSHSNAFNTGFKTVVYTELKEFMNIWAGSPTQRKEALENAFKSNINCIWAFKGGSGVIHFLKDVNFKLLRKEPKLFIGYSDLTPILNNINQKARLIALHGPSGIKPMDEVSASYLKKALQMQDYSIPFTKKVIYKGTSSRVKAIINGGNLAMVSWSLGSSFQIELKNKIVFFEDIGTNDEIAYNRLIQLKLSNSLKPKALLFGYLQDVKNMEKFILGVQEIFPDVPIIYDLPIGHKQPNITIPIGSTCTIDFKKNEISFLFKKKHHSYRCSL